MRYRIEEIYVSPMGTVRWLPVGAAYASRGEAEAAMVRLNQRGGRERRIVAIGIAA